MQFLSFQSSSLTEYAFKRNYPLDLTAINGLHLQNVVVVAC